MFLCFSNGTEVMVKVHVVDLKAETVAAPVTVRAYLNQTVTEFKQLISKVSFKNRSVTIFEYLRCIKHYVIVTSKV